MKPRRRKSARIVQRTADDGPIVVTSSAWNSWQSATRPSSWAPGSYGPVYACWKIISEEVSRVPLKHVARNADGSLTQNFESPAARIFRNPNRYQTRSDFLLYLVWSLLSEGNAYARVVRNGRFEPAALFPVHPRMCYPHIDMSTGDVYYQVSDTYQRALAQVDDSGWVPERDMLHIRLFTPTHPLIGETPLVAAALSVNAGAAINAQVATFFGNMARPSGIIRHPKPLKDDAVLRIKEKFIDATTRDNAGTPVVFPEGMEWQALTMSAVDAELIASAKLTQSQIAEIYRVPPFMLGNLEQAKFASVEALTRWFINSGLGFYLDHISDSFTRFFMADKLREEVMFDYEAAMFRADFKQFMDALAAGTGSGILSPDEGRAMRGLPPVEGGHGKMPRVQQQMVPLSWGGFNEQSAPQTDPTSTPADAAARSVRIELMRRSILGVAV